MAKFVKKPVEIEAHRFAGGFSEPGIPMSWLKDGMFTIMPDGNKIIIPTLEGDMIGDKGDWIIKGIKGEYYPCKPDIFEKSYDEVSDDFRDRVVKEKEALDEKIDKLQTFILRNPLFMDLSEEDKSDLKHQLNAMTTYSNILLMRISRFQ